MIIDAPAICAERTCTFCAQQVSWRIEGYAEDGEDEGFVYSLCCDEHKRDAEEWADQEDNDKPHYWHGYVYFTRFEAL